MPKLMTDRVVRKQDREDHDAPVWAYMWQLTGVLIAIQNCEKILPMIAAAHPDDWERLRRTTRQRAQLLTELSQQIEAITPPATRRRKPILRYLTSKAR